MGKQPQSYKMTEAEFLQQIRDTAHLFGWLTYHTLRSKGSEAGFPDMCLLREREDGTASLCFLELKSEKGTLTSEQVEWLDILNKVPGVVAKCVKPSDWDDLIAFLRNRGK